MHTNHFFVSNLTADAVVSGSYIIQDIQFCTTRTGTPYLRATLNDATGSIRMLFWDYDNSSTPLFDGAIVNINGTVGHYRGILQITAESLCLTDLGMLDQEDMDSLVPSAPIDVDACGKYVISLADNVKTAGLHDICDYLFYKHWDCFSSIPAAKSVHHAFLHGLLMHTADMAVAAEAIITNNESYINRDLLIAGILLHDIGKILEFEISPITGLVTGYTDKGNLLGHPVLGAMEIREAAETVGANPYLTMLLEHMILSHHCVVKVLYQEKNGERTERLKTVNAYRYVILSYWASVMIKKCLDIMGLDSSDDRLLVTGQNLSRWIRNILMNYDEAFVTEMESIERTNPDYDEDGKPIYDISAYALRRNAASRWLNYDGLTHDEIDIMLGHKDKGGQPVIYLMDESDQQRIADKLEHYVYNQKYTRNPAFQPYNVTSGTQMDLNPYPVHRIVNGSGKKMRIRLDLLSCCPDEAIDLIVPRGATGEPICRSEPIKLENRIVVNANYDPHKGEFDNENV